MKIVSFSGHRWNGCGGFCYPNKTTDYIGTETEKLLLLLNPDKCITGMAQGYDLIAAEVCIKLNIPFIAAMPFIGQESLWPAESQEFYKSVLAMAEKVEIISKGGYSAKKMQIRNCWMSDNSNEAIVCYNGSSGGTANFIAYHTLQGKPIHIINPTKVQ